MNHNSVFLFISDSSTPSPSTNSTTTDLPPTTTQTTPIANASPFNKVAGSVLVCLGVPIVSFLGLKLFVYLFPDCCQKSDFKRLHDNCKECITSIFCPRQKTNIVTPTITKGIELFTAQKIIRGDGKTDDDNLGGGNDILRMIVTLNKTKTQFRELTKARGNRRNSDSSLETLDGAIINTTDVESATQIIENDKFRSASRSPTPPPHIVVIYPEENASATPSPSVFRPIRDTADLDGQDINEMSPLEQNVSHSNTSSPAPDLTDTIRTATNVDVQNGLKSPAFKQITTQAEVNAVDSPRSALSGQSVPRNQTKILARSNTKESMCIIKIELPERTEPDGMEAPIPERSERDDSSFLTVGSTDYRGESDGGEDSHGIGEVDSYFKQKLEPDSKLSVDQNPVKVDALKGALFGHSDKISLVRRGSYGCEADTAPIMVANAHIAVTAEKEPYVSPCSTCTSSPGSGVDPGSGDEADEDDDDDPDSYYSISCPSSNATPLTSQMNSPEQSPVKKSKRVRDAKRALELRSRSKDSLVKVVDPTINLSQQEQNTSGKQVTLRKVDMHRSANPDHGKSSANEHDITNSQAEDSTHQLTLSELPAKIVRSQDGQDILAKEIPEQPQEILPHQQSTKTIESEISMQVPHEQTVKDSDNQKTKIKSHSSRFKKKPTSSSLNTGVYSSPTRRVLQKPRTHMSSPMVKSKSNLSKSSKTSSTVSSSDSPFKSSFPVAQQSGGSVENSSLRDNKKQPYSPKKEATLIQKDTSSPNGSLRKAAAAKKVTALLKRDSTTSTKTVGSPKKESAVDMSEGKVSALSVSFKRSGNASPLYRKIPKKVP